MNQEIKAKWIAALRSGEYEQGTGALRTCNDKFCCLGVLADLHRKEVGGCWEWDDADGGRYIFITRTVNDFATAELPRTTLDWAGLEWCNPQLSEPVPYPSLDGRLLDRKVSTLAAANDSGYSFDHIADIIEQQF